MVQLPVLAKPLTPVRPGSIGGVCCWTRSVSHGGTAAIGPSRSSSSSAVHHRLPPPPFPFLNVQLKVALAPLPERWRLDGCLAMKDRESTRPPLSPPSRALPPRRSGTIVGQHHFLKRVVVPVWGPWRLVRQEGTGERGIERPCGAATQEDERLLSSTGCGCQSWLQLRRKRKILANRQGRWHLASLRSCWGSVEVNTPSTILTRNLSGRVLAFPAATTTAATVLSLPATPYHWLMTTWHQRGEGPIASPAFIHTRGAPEGGGGGGGIVHKRDSSSHIFDTLDCLSATIMAQRAASYQQ